MKPRLQKLRLYPLDTVDANLDPKQNKKAPLILTQVELQSSNIVLHPTIDEVQQWMHQLVNYVLKIFHGVRQWGEVREIDMDLIHTYPMHDFSEFVTTNGSAEREKIAHRDEEESRSLVISAKTYYHTIINNKELLKLYQNIGHFFVENSARYDLDRRWSYLVVSLVDSYEKELEEYYQLRHIWEMDKVSEAKQCVLADPDYAAVRSIFAGFDETRELVKRIAETKDVDPFRYDTRQLKSNLLDEIRQSELTFAKHIRGHYRTKFLSINDFFKKNEPRLNRQLRDLDDVRFVINYIGYIERELRSYRSHHRPTGSKIFNDRDR